LFFFYLVLIIELVW